MSTKQTNLIDTPLAEFLRWWTKEPGASRKMFAPELDYDAAGMDTKGQLWLKEQQPAFKSVRVLEMFSTKTDGALTLEGVDQITLLTFRISWLFKIRDGLITRVIETAMSVTPRPSE